MTTNELIRNRAQAWSFAMGWANEGAAGARFLRFEAAKIKREFCTNGMWNPDAEIVHLYFMEAAAMAESQ